MTWWTDLKQFISNGDSNGINSMLSQVSVADIRDDHDSNLLHYFTNTDNETIARQLIEAGCDINLKNRYGETPLMTAVESNNLKIAKLLLDAGAIHLNTNFIEEFGPLHMAVWYGFKAMVRILLDAGADANVIDEEYSSPLHLAAKVEPYAAQPCLVPGDSKCNYDIAKMLVDAGADVDAVDYQAISPLHWAVMRGNYDVAGLLLDKGANADVMDDNFVTPLHWSVRDLNIEFVKRLIKAGANVDMVDCHGMTCLHYAVKARFNEMVWLLLSAGATPNCTDGQGYSPLHWAVREESLELVQILLEAGADVNIQDDQDTEGLSALQVAAELGLKDIILLLLSHGADVKAKCNRGCSVLYYAAMCKRINFHVDDELYVELLRLLLDHGAEIGDSSCSVKTSFDSALLYWNEQAVRLFIERGVDLRKCILGNSKSSSLYDAALNNGKSVLKFLVDSGHFNIEQKYGSGLTALHLASFWNKFNCVKFLLKRGANINNNNVFGETPLYSAIQNGHAESVRLLLTYDADVNVKTTRNQTILSAALETSRQDIVLYVVRHIAKVEAQQLRVERENLRLIASFEDLHDFYEKCRTELALMEGSYIHGIITFFDILTARDIGKYARNEHVVRTFDTVDLSEYFPIYQDLLIERFDKEMKRQVLMKQAMAGLSRILRCDADTFHVLFYNVFRYLGTKDLRNLVDV
ncbi:putative ankyrin repeat protein RF_0381 isoform X1 [Nasonia vitripennis]|uniref:Uncharacterized protein n=3 Tax=Nasonia vitripennis TaxID=7425 RepID=A0A7M7LND9_NASVI|nr:putative ankyrin repeat protein RF_0381 isoform X1 [Nasonia vitripennis]